MVETMSAEWSALASPEFVLVRQKMQSRSGATSWDSGLDHEFGPNAVGWLAVDLEQGRPHAPGRPASPPTETPGGPLDATLPRTRGPRVELPAGAPRFAGRARASAPR